MSVVLLHHVRTQVSHLSGLHALTAFDSSGTERPSARAYALVKGTPESVNALPRTQSPAQCPSVNSSISALWTE
ncbi:hypothetical protein KC336_g20 [Hortaea werneckii]|nr:hypothetical protein KC336_g20 [Hortaea werneckii]